MDGIPAITLWQPWASLVACGVKTWETRGWPTKYRGRLVIHAAASVPAVERRALVDRSAPRGGGQYKFREHLGDYSLDGVGRGVRRPLPLGAIVATANLVDCCPIGDPYSFRTGIHEGDEGDYPGQGVVVVHPPLYGEDLWTLTHDDADTVVHDITDQLPFGIWEPGRWAWRLEDIAPTTERCPACWGVGRWASASTGDVHDIRITCLTCEGDGSCEPVPAKGGQRLWRWRP